MPAYSKAMHRALLEIGSQTHAPSATARRPVVTAYVVRFGEGRRLYGPFADRYGRTLSWTMDVG